MKLAQAHSKIQHRSTVLNDYDTEFVDDNSDDEHEDDAVVRKAEDVNADNCYDDYEDEEDKDGAVVR